MRFHKAILGLLLFAPLVVSQQCKSDVTCTYVSTPPTLDGDFSDWSDVAGINIELQMIGALNGTTYPNGNLQAKCVYDDSQIYLTMDVPGAFSFNETNNELCAAIGIMLKVGQDASFVDMGGCPDAADQPVCTDELIAACTDHLVDIGAHWELKTTEQGVKYDVNGGTGNDEVANKDDEFAVHSDCRRDDDIDNPGNEWSGAWAYTAGSYKFELARTLGTPSATTDVQLAPGNTYEFGYAFWDPFETEDGWTAPGHYVSGCGTEWMKLTLESTAATDPSTTTAMGATVPPVTTTMAATDPLTTTTMAATDPPVTTTMAATDPLTTTTVAATDPPPTTTMAATVPPPTTTVATTSAAYIFSTFMGALVGALGAGALLI